MEETPGPRNIILAPLTVDRILLLGFVVADDHLLLNLVAFDRNNDVYLRIQNNVLAYSTDPWDIMLQGTRLQIRERPRNSLLDMRFEPPTGVRIDRGRFLCNGVEVVVAPDRMIVGGNTFIDATMEVPFGFVVGALDDSLTPCGVHIPHVDRYASHENAEQEWRFHC